MHASALVAGTFLLLLIAERLFPLRRPRHRKAPRVGRNLGLAAVGLVATRLVVLAPVLAVSQWGLSHRFGMTHQLPDNPGLRLGLALVAFDYTMYLWHRMNHEVRFLWRFHQVHHADVELDVSTAVRFHFGELLLSGGFRAAQAALLGLTPAMLLVGETMVTVAACLHHANVGLPRKVEKFLLLFVVTPRMHLIHHSVVRGETNSNYGTVATLWDRVHRSLRLGIPEDAIRIGIPACRNSRDVTFVRLLRMPFRRIPPWRLPDGTEPVRNDAVSAVFRS